MLNNKKERYDTVNSTSRRPPGALSSSAAETESNAGGAEEMNQQNAIRESMKEVTQINTHLHDTRKEEELEPGKDEASSQSQHVLDEGQPEVENEHESEMIQQKKIPRNKGMQSGHWSREERDLFSLALKVFGSNFYGMEKVFPNRNRQELKNKFKDLVKNNPRLLEESMSEKKSLNELLKAVREGTAPQSTSSKSSTQTKRSKRKKQLTGSKKIKGTATMGPHTTESALVSASATPSAVTRVFQKNTVVPRISNIVASVNLGCKIYIDKIVGTLLNSEWDPKQSSRVALRLCTSTANVFKSGKIMCFGAKSIQQALLDTRKYASMVKHCGNSEVKFANFEIKTITASATVAYYIKLEALALKHASCSKYTPEVTPGLKFKMQDPKVTLNIFSTGNIVLTGGRSEDDVKRAFEKILKIIQEFKKE